MPRLHVAWTAVVVALLGVLGAGVPIVRALLRDAVVACDGGLEITGEHAISADPRFEVVPLDGDYPRFRVLADEHMDPRRSTTYYRNARLVPSWCAAGGDECACREIRLRWLEKTRGAHPEGVHLFRDTRSGAYLVKGEDVWGKEVGPDDGETLAIFRESSARMHDVSLRRALTARRLPTVVFLFALAALAVAAARIRRATAYATRMHAWVEAKLMPGGMLASEDGATVGMLASGLRAVPAGPVIVAPDAIAASTSYRELPIVARRKIAAGSHERWRAGTARRLRDARALAIVSVVCSAIAVVAQLLGS